MMLSIMRTASRHQPPPAPSMSSRASGGERMLDKARQIDRAEQAGAVGRQRLLATRIGRLDLLAIPQVVPAVDAVDEDDAGLGIGVGRAHDLVPQLARRQHLGTTVPPNDSSQGASSSTACMKASVTSTDRLNMRSRPGSRLASMKASMSGWSQRQRRHHRAAAIAGAHDRAAHRVPHIHEGQRPRGVGADALHRRAARPQGREIVADAAALLHRQRRLAQMGEDAAHIVGDRAHHEAVEQGDLAVRCRRRRRPGRPAETGNRSSPRRTARPSAPGLVRARRQARATRRQVSSIVLSIGSPASSVGRPFSRYFMSQICCEIEATVAICVPSDSDPHYGRAMDHSSRFVHE